MMPIAISSKGNDINAWRTAGDFGAAFREALLKRTATMTSERAEALFLEVGQGLEQRAAEHDACLNRLRQLTAEIGSAGEPADLSGPIQEFYAASYAFFGLNRSATAFYRLGEEFFRAVSGRILAGAVSKLGPLVRKLPPLAVIALGPAGHHEFSPFCRLQLLLVHGEADPSLAESIELLGRELHEGFEAAGLQPDQVITTRNPDWRGDPLQWRQRIVAGLERGEADELIELLRLADQSALHDEEGVGAAFRSACLRRLAESKAAMHNLAIRLHDLSGGLGLMGGIRLERSGPHRGLFRLLEHALLPLSAGITALSLMSAIDACETPQRIRGLLAGGWLNVETAERLLEAWHLFNELRLAQEAAWHPHWTSRDVLYLDMAAFSEARQEEIHEGLETVAAFQRHVGITFGGWEEQAAC